MQIVHYGFSKMVKSKDVKIVRVFTKLQICKFAKMQSAKLPSFAKFTTKLIFILVN